MLLTFIEEIRPGELSDVGISARTKLLSIPLKAPRVSKTCEFN